MAPKNTLMTTQAPTPPTNALCALLAGMNLDASAHKPAASDQAQLDPDKLASHLASIDISSKTTSERYFGTLTPAEINAIMNEILDINLRTEHLDNGAEYHRSCVAYAKFDKECYNIVVANINKNIVKAMRMVREAQYFFRDKELFDASMKRVGTLLKAYGEVVPRTKGYENMDKEDFFRMIDGSVALIQSDWLSSSFVSEDWNL